MSWNPPDGRWTQQKRKAGNIPSSWQSRPRLRKKMRCSPSAEMERSATSSMDWLVPKLHSVSCRLAQRTSGALNWGCGPLPGHPWALRKNAAILANAPCHSVDVGMCNQFSFMMWAGIGLDAMAIQSLEPRIRLEKFFAMPEYAAQAIWNAAQWSGMRLRLWADEQEVEGHSFWRWRPTSVITWVVSRTFHPMHISMMVCLIYGCSVGTILVMHCVMLMICGAALMYNSDAVQRITFHNLRVEAESLYWIQTDGEARGSTQKAEISDPNPRIETAHAARAEWTC